MLNDNLCNILLPQRMWLSNGLLARMCLLLRKESEHNRRPFSWVTALPMSVCHKTSTTTCFNFNKINAHTLYRSVIAVTTKCCEYFIDPRQKLEKGALIVDTLSLIIQTSTDIYCVTWLTGFCRLQLLSKFVFSSCANHFL